MWHTDSRKLLLVPAAFTKSAETPILISGHVIANYSVTIMFSNSSATELYYTVVTTELIGKTCTVDKEGGMRV